MIIFTFLHTQVSMLFLRYYFQFFLKSQIRLVGTKKDRKEKKKEWKKKILKAFMFGLFLEMSRSPCF